MIDPRAGAPTAERWAGAVLAACCLTFTVTMVVYLTAYGQPAPAVPGGEITVADRAAHVLEKWSLVSALWIVEALAWIALAVAAFVLQHRSTRGTRWLPTRAAWTAVGVGAVIQAIMYSLTLGAYPVAAADAEASPALFSALSEAAWILFYLGNATVYLGLGGAFLGEASPGGVIPKWVALLGGVICLVVALLLVGLLAGVGAMMIVAPFAFFGFFLTIYLGLSIWRRGE